MTCYHLTRARQTLEIARRSVVTRHHDTHVEPFSQPRRQGGLDGIHGHRGGLDDRCIGVAIHNQTGQGIGFTMNHPEGIPIHGQVQTPGYRGLDSVAHQGQQSRQ